MGGVRRQKGSARFFVTILYVCPSCGGSLERAPRRRAGCKHCGQPILVRRGHLYTEDEARSVDACFRVGLPLDRLWEERDVLSARWGKRASAGDAAWGIMNQLVVRTANYHARGMIYWHMARFLWEEKKDHLQMARMVRAMELANWKHLADLGQLDLRRMRVIVITAHESACSNCLALEGRSFSYEEAVETMPIPVANCTTDLTDGRTRGWCRCLFGLESAW